MPRKARQTEPGFYHIVNRGVERRLIFLEHNDYEKFFDLMYVLTQEFDIIIHSFSLMTNHYHILLETKQKNISKAIQFLNDKYAKYFNKKYKRSGHLWQGRFKSYSIYDDTHFWITSKYIERNPLKAGMVKTVDTYMYNSFFQYKYRTDYYEILKNSKIFDMTLKEYEEYISTDLHMDAIDTVYKSPKVILKDDKLVVLTKRVETFFQIDKDIDRNRSIKNAYEYGYTKSEIARFIELSPSSVSKIISKKNTHGVE